MTLCILFASISLAALSANIVSYAWPSLFAFSTASNAAFAAAGICLESIGITSKTCLLDASPFVLMLMGASSFAFHSTSVLNSTGHILDITTGWLLIMHVCFVSITVTLNVAFNLRGRVITSTIFAASLTGLFCNYETVYTHQVKFYFAMGGGAAIFGGLDRFALMRSDGKTLCVSVLCTLIETSILLLAVFAAVIAQCEILPAPFKVYSKETNPQMYDLFHGHWHILMSYAISILYTSLMHKQWSVNVFEWTCLIALFFYSLAVIVLKEFIVTNITNAKISLTTVQALLCLHAAAIVFWKRCGKRYKRIS